MPYSDQPTYLPSSNQDHQQSVDSLISASWVIPIEPLGTTLSNHTVAIKDGVIVAVVPTEEAQKRFQAKQSLAMPGCALMPGLINLHSHAAMSLLRGVGDDLPLMQWLEKRIWPLEAGLMSDAFVYDGSVMAFAEMLSGGTTCCNDMYFFQTGAARAAHELGIRAVIGITALEFATPCAADFNAYLPESVTSFGSD